MIYAALHSSTPILVKHQSHLLRFGFVSLKPDFRLEKDGCLERGSPLDYLGAAGRNPSGACCGGSRPLSCGLGGAGFGHFLLDAGECRFVRFVRSFRCRFHVYLELQEEPRLTLPLNTMIEAAKTRVCSIAHRCLCNHHQPSYSGRLARTIALGDAPAGHPASERSGPGFGFSLEVPSPKAW